MIDQFINKTTHGDMLEILKTFPDNCIDAIVTDPPWPDCNVDLGWLGPEWWEKVVKTMQRILHHRGKVIIILNSEINPGPFLNPFSLPFIHICWMKYIPPRYRGNILNSADLAYQLGYGFLPKGRKVLGEESPSTSNKHIEKINFHPTPRNQIHMDWLITSQVGPDRIVLDPFAGSGTIGVATIKNRSKFIGIELKKKYIEPSNKLLMAAEKGISVQELNEGQNTLF